MRDDVSGHGVEQNWGQVTILTVRSELHETREDEDHVPRESAEISVDDDTPPDLMHAHHDESVSFEM